MLHMELRTSGWIFAHDADARLERATERMLRTFTEKIADGVRRDVGVALDRERGEAGQVSVTTKQVGQRFVITAAPLASSGVEGWPATVTTEQAGAPAYKPGIGYVMSDGTLGQSRGTAVGDPVEDEAARQERFATMVSRAVGDAQEHALDAAVAEFGRALS